MTYCNECDLREFCVICGKQVCRLGQTESEGCCSSGVYANNGKMICERCYKKYFVNLSWEIDQGRVSSM